MQSNILNLTNFCKGLAITLIFLVHYRDNWFGWQGVHLFIVLSGFGLAYSCAKQTEKINWLTWFQRRMRRVLPVYWIAVLFSFPLLAYFSSIKFAVVRTFLDCFLLTNVFEAFRGGATSAFWYVPFIVGAYIIFPSLYKQFQKYTTVQAAILILLLTMGVEFSYRAVAIYYLDGLPIAHTEKFLEIFPNTVKALNKQPDWFFGFFQRRSPFGFILARIGEFTLGMVAGLALVKNRQKFHNLILNPYTGWLGLIIWFVGQALLYVGLWGWIFTDFVIALGMILWVVNLADFTQNKIPILFQALTGIGVWSYYIYLTHQPFTRLFPRLEGKLIPENSSLIYFVTLEILCFAATLITVYFVSDLARKFDQSGIPDRIMDQLNQILKILLQRFGLISKEKSNVNY